MRKQIIAFLMVIAVLMFAGCSKVSDKEKSASKTTSKAVSSVIKTGVVTEASMHVVEIEAPDGTTYIFSIDDKTKVDGDGVKLGNTLEITYDGEYKESVPAKNIHTVKVAKNETPAAPTPEKTPAPEKAPTQAPTPAQDNPTSGTYSEYGDVVEVTDTSITIITNDNDEYTFVRNSDTLVNADVSKGCTIEVRFTGDINNYPVATQIAPPPEL